MFFMRKQKKIPLRRVLVVDDVDFNIEFEENIIKALAREKKMDIFVDTANSVQGAKERISNNEPYDAMVIDMNLADGSGAEIAKVAYEKSQDTRLAALTIYPSKYEDQQGYFDLFLRKPIMPHDYKQHFTFLLQLEN